MNQAHHLPATTHTVEMAQLADINGRLVNSRASTITAGELGLNTADGDPALSPAAALVRVSWEGSPEFPLVHGHFRDSASADATAVELHTQALRVISRRLHLQHRWGV